MPWPSSLLPSPILIIRYGLAVHLAIYPASRSLIFALVEAAARFWHRSKYTLQTKTRPPESRSINSGLNKLNGYQVEILSM